MSIKVFEAEVTAVLTCVIIADNRRRRPELMQHGDSQLFCGSVLSDSVPWLFHRDSLERRITVVEGLRCTETRSKQEFLNEVLKMPTCLFQLK